MICGVVQEHCGRSVASAAAQSSLLASPLAPPHSLLQFAAIKRTPEIRCQLKQCYDTI